MLFCILLPVLSFSNWDYIQIKNKKVLTYNKNPFPIYEDVLNPLGYFTFTAFATNPFNFYGWVKKTNIPSITSKGKLNDKELKQGWAFSEFRPNNLPQGWIFFPKTSLWANPDTFLKLFRFWKQYYENIPLLSSQIYNLIQDKKFYRITTNYLDKELLNIQVELPKNWIKVYQKDIYSNGYRKLLIFYPLSLPPKEEKKIHIIKLIYYYPHGKKVYKNYFIIYQKDTGLNYNSF